MSSRRQMLEFLSLSRLPSAFQEVEYLESTGTQYIATQKLLNNTSKVFIDFKEKTLKTFANYFGTDQPYWFFNRRDDVEDHKRLYINNKYIDFTLETYNTRKKLTFDVSGVYDNGTKIATLETPSQITNPKPMFIFTRSETQVKSDYELYSIKVYDNNTLVCNFVPCYRKADNVAGLYDLVNGVFYTNAGTGTFIVGGNV